ncbi:hypothetical protein QJN73_25285, partial [Escherichia coli]
IGAKMRNRKQEVAELRIFPAVLSVIMVFWIGAKMRNRKQEVAE